MKTIKRILGLPLMIGIPFPILFANQEHHPWFAALAFAFAFIGTGLTMGFSNFKTKPTHIGNFDEDGVKPSINQTWVVFFISLIIDLTVANLF
jgi:hypothetical protein